MTTQRQLHYIFDEVMKQRGDAAKMVGEEIARIAQKGGAL